MRALALAFVFALLSSCAASRPDEPSNACAIYEQHKSWWRAAKRAERRWGAPPALQLAIIRQESGFDHDARPARGKFLFVFPGARASSAHGYAQALNTTWREYETARGDPGLDRDEFSDATDFVAWYAGITQRRLNVPYANARAHYLAYHEGRGGYSRGSYRGKRTLLASAARVQAYRDTYQRQLDGCARRLDGSWLPFL